MAAHHHGSVPEPVDGQGTAVSRDALRQAQRPEPAHDHGHAEPSAAVPEPVEGQGTAVSRDALRRAQRPEPAHDHGHNHDHGHSHDHGHTHGGGVRGFLRELFVPHTHDPSDAVDDALESSVQGVRALKISLSVLLATTILQFVVVMISGSVALLADTVHNFSDALTAVPLWIAFVLGRRAATRRYPSGFGRAEDLAGLFIVIVVALSAVVAAWQSVVRIIDPQPIQNIGWVAVAGVIGFLGNEAVAIYRIRVGRRIGSAALVADGVHARTDGFTSLAVVIGALGVALGFPLADPIVGVLISVAIVVLLWGTVRSVGRRLMDGIEPDLVDSAEHAIAHVDGVVGIDDLRLRWVGHRVHGNIVVRVEDAPFHEIESLVARVEQEIREHVPHADLLHVSATTGARTR